MFKFNNSIVPYKVCIGCHFSSNKYVYRDAYSALKNSGILVIAVLAHRLMSTALSSVMSTSIYYK